MKLGSRRTIHYKAVATIIVCLMEGFVGTRFRTASLRRAEPLMSKMFSEKRQSAVRKGWGRSVLFRPPRLIKCADCRVSESSKDTYGTVCRRHAA